MSRRAREPSVDKNRGHFEEKKNVTLRKKEISKASAKTVVFREHVRKDSLEVEIAPIHEISSKQYVLKSVEILSFSKLKTVSKRIGSKDPLARNRVFLPHGCTMKKKD